MVSHSQAPSTPPRKVTRDFPATPGTPRFGALEDMPDITLKRSQTKKQAAPSYTGLLATPRQTPARKRAIFPPAITTPVRGSGRTHTHIHKKKPAIDSAVVAAAAAAAALHAEERHPHASEPQGPGMWFVFRGKKMFRSLPEGESRPEPKRLFAAELEQQRQQRRGTLRFDVEEFDSEADTDHEL